MKKRVRDKGSFRKGLKYLNLFITSFFKGLELIGKDFKKIKD